MRHVRDENNKRRRPKPSFTIYDLVVTVCIWVLKVLSRRVLALTSASKSIKHSDVLNDTPCGEDGQKKAKKHSGGSISRPTATWLSLFGMWTKICLVLTVTGFVWVFA